MSAGLLIVACAAIALTDAATIPSTVRKATDACNSPVYCDGKLLQVVQLARIFNDSKTFVDLYQLHDPAVTLSNFEKLMARTNNNPNRTETLQFVQENFAMQDELHNWTLSDWKKDPAILNRIKDPKYRAWASELNAIWKNLARKINDDVALNPTRHSLIYVENGFIIPGGRFKEFYYWDSFWVIEGLLLCNMTTTARGMIDNFMSMVEKYGFIPNGGRVYYLMRSQPPMLMHMTEEYLKHTKDYGYLADQISTLEKEFDFWQTQKLIDVQKNGKTYKMAHYVTDSPSPRPESYIEDYQLAQNLPENKRGEFYDDLKAAAESGWDFSSRWFISDGAKGEPSLLNISTSAIIPVDLNAILQKNARLLSEFHGKLGNPEKAKYYEKIAANYQAAIDNVLWNEEEGVWLDYDTKNKRSRNVFYPTNLTPLYTMSYNRIKRADYASKAVKYLKKNKIESFFGGVPTSLQQTGEQWDFPNAWPPLQSFIVLGLYQTGVKEAVDLAETLASRWLYSNYIGFDEYGKMFEKYDAILPGRGGGGGEYMVQDGFGWTNGIAFEFFSLFPNSKPQTPTN